MTAELDNLERELANFESEQHGGRKSGRFRMLPIVVAVAAVLGFGGILWYVYSQGVREGSEDVAPVIQPEGPAKIKPDDPGGLVVPNQDKQVFNVLEGTPDDVEDTVEVLLPSPEEPMQLPEPAGGETASVAKPPVAAAPEIPSITAPVIEDPPLPSPDLAAPETPPTLLAVENPEAAAAEPDPVVEPAPEPVAEPAQTAAPAPADLSKAWRIQIAAVKSEAAARKEWSRVQKRNTGLLGDLTLDIQQTTVNGTKYFRIRGGPLTDRASAVKLCGQLKAKKLGCLIVKPGA